MAGENCNLDHNLKSPHALSNWHRYNKYQFAREPLHAHMLLTYIMPAIPLYPPNTDIDLLAGTQECIPSSMSSCTLNTSSGIHGAAAYFEMQEEIPETNSSTINKKEPKPASANTSVIVDTAGPMSSVPVSEIQESLYGHVVHHQGHVATLGIYWELCPKESPNWAHGSCNFTHIQARAENHKLLPVNYLWQYRLPEPESNEDGVFYYNAIKRCSSTGFLWIDFLDEDQQKIEKAFWKLDIAFSFPHIAIEYAIHH